MLYLLNHFFSGNRIKYLINRRNDQHQDKIRLRLRDLVLYDLVKKVLQIAADLFRSAFSKQIFDIFHGLMHHHLVKALCPFIV